ncbi:MAG: MG2 domain-containing protein, partial [Desulfovibrionaceae bacterium]|nr:MG2 domain-containing protein [Desulfovibrionaceae bacterium]
PRPSPATPLPLLAAAHMPALLAAMLLTPRPAAAGPSYQRLVTDEPARTSWRDGLTVSFVMDEAQCRRAYGRAWPQECAAALPGSEGMRAAGVQLTPRTPGEWRWLSPGIMRFTPSTPDGALAPNTRYRIDVGGMRLPPRLRLAQTVVDYVTQPQAASPGEERIWIDPSPAAAHGVSLALTFIWPADRARVEERVRLAPSDSASGLRLGETRYSWSAGGDSVVVSARVLSLPAKDSRISLALGGLPVWSLNRSGERVLREPSGRPAYSFGMPGTSGLFSFKSISLVRGHDQLLNIRHELDFSTTLRVDPKTLLDALTVVELPEKAEPGAAVPTDWTAMPGLSPRDLEAGRRLEPRLVSGTEPSDRVRVAVPVGAGRCAAVLISGKLASVGGPGLKADVIRILKAPDSAAELSFLQPGNILALGGSGRIALHCTGLDSLRWRARRVRTPFLAMFAATRGFSAQASEDWRADDSLDSLTETGTGRLDLQPGPEGQAVFPLLDLRDLLPGLRGAPGLLHLELEGLRGGRTVVRASRMLLATNIGLIVKEEADGRRLVFVQSLSTGLAASGLKTQLLARNGAVLAEAESNASGLAVLPAAGDREGEREPVAVIARTQGTSQDLAWLSLKDRSRVLDNGEFSVRGRHGTEAGLLASVFSQRDLYMPGEMLHFGIMVRRFDWKPLPAGLPLETILTDPAGRVLQRQPLVGRPDLAEVSWKSPAGASTGPYRLDVRIRGDDGQGPVLGSCSVRVEEFEPDTLSMTCELTPAVRRGWIRTGQGAAPAARVTLRTLYGEAARQHTLRPSFTVSPARLTFPGYEGYSFCDPSLDAGETRELRLPQASTDDEGRAEVSLPVSSVAGTFLGTLRVEGYEAAGGRAVTRQVPALFSPLSVIMGYRPTGRAGTLESIPQGEKAGLRIAALNSRLEPAALEGLTCTIASRRYINTLVRDSRGEFRYETAPLDRKLRSAGIELADGRADIALRTQEAGDFVLTVTGSRGETLLSVPYTVAGRDLRPAGDGTSDSMTDGNLRLRLARDSYEPGEDIVLRFSAPFAGSGLITIEREKVVSSVWFRCEAGESEQHIRVPADFEGQGYVNLLFSRAATSDAIYLKPVAHAAAPFSCGLRRRDMGLRLEAPQSVAPGGSMEVLLRSRKPGRVLLFAVDEGILSLTGFASPNPLKDLLCGRALDVVTRQTFDLLMPDSQRLAGRLPAFGGGMSMTGGRFLNPFRRRTEPPFAWWLGFADVGPDGTRVAIHVPSYLSGRIRVMAVGTSDADSLLAAGSAEAAVAVRGSLLVRPVLPLAVSPGDVFSCAVTVANTVAGSGRDVPVTLTITPKSALELVEGSAEHSLTISENEEVTVPFTLRAGDVLGSAGVVFAARIA